MSQNAYALFQTIKTIKGHTMINTYTMTERRQEKIPVLIATSTQNANSQLTTFSEHIIVSSVSNDATGLFVPAGPYTHIKIYPLVKNITTATTMRVTGWTQIKDTNTYVPTLLVGVTIGGVQSTTAITNNSVALKFVHTVTLTTAGLGVNTLINNSGDKSVSSLIVPQFGCSYIEVDFVSATTAQTAFGNFYYSYCSI